MASVDATGKTGCLELASVAMTGEAASLGKAFVDMTDRNILRLDMTGRNILSLDMTVGNTFCGKDRIQKHGFSGSNRKGIRLHSTGSSLPFPIDINCVADRLCSICS